MTPMYLTISPGAGSCSKSLRIVAGARSQSSPTRLLKSAPSHTALRSAFHEWDARLPSQPCAALELRIRSIRAVLYALVFAGPARFNRLGLFAWLFALHLAMEIALTGAE